MVGVENVPDRSPAVMVVVGWTAVLALLREDCTLLLSAAAGMLPARSLAGMPELGLTYLAATLAMMVWVGVSSWVVVTEPACS